MSSRTDITSSYDYSKQTTNEYQPAYNTTKTSQPYYTS